MTQSSSEHSPLSLGLRIRRISLQTRLVLFMLFTALVPLIFISMRNIIQAQQAYIKSAETSLLSDAERTASNLDSFINNVLNSSKIESQFTDFSSYLEMAPSLRSGSLEGEHARDLLEKLGRKDPINIISYALLDVNGVVLMDTAKDDSRTNESNESNDFATKSLDSSSTSILLSNLTWNISFFFLARKLTNKKEYGSDVAIL